jgi:hypothetical protein
VWQAIEATCARQTADLALRDQVRWAVAIFGAWQESLPADRDAMPTATAQRRADGARGTPGGYRVRPRA